MVIQTLKENSVNYKFYTTNSTLVKRKPGRYEKSSQTMAGTGNYRTPRRNLK